MQRKTIVGVNTLNKNKMKEILDYKLRMVYIENRIDDIKKELSDIPMIIDEESSEILSKMSLEIFKLMEEFKLLKSIVADEYTYCKKFRDLNDCVEKRVYNAACHGCKESFY